MTALDDEPQRPADAATLATLRALILGLLVFGLVGLGVELLFLKHFESPAQVIAPGLVGAALVSVAWHFRERGARSLRVLQAVMWLFVGAGGLGLYFHYAANVEFQREMDPSIGGIALVRKALAAKAPPALAPGAMAQLGLLGLAYAFRHPARRPDPSRHQRRPK